MKFSKALMMLAFALVPAVASAGGADLMLRSMAKKAAMPPAAQGSWSKALSDEGGLSLVPCLIRSRDAHATVDAIEDAGGRAVIISDEIISAHLSPESVEAITSRPEVVVAEGALPLHQKMDSARAATRVDVVQNGSALGVSYLGKNVVVGVVDGSLYYGHQDFTSGGTTRVQYVEQTSGATKTDCFKSEIIDGSCAITDSGQGSTHGTHVTGTAAGANSTFTGVAPEADIMFVFDSSSDADTSGSMATAVVEGVAAIFSKADTIDKPAVVNLSLGTSLGAHDGTSLLEQGLDALTKAGRIIVGAAGNEQTNPNSLSAAAVPVTGGIHAPISVPAGTSAGYRIAVWSGADATRVFTGGTTVDIWLDAGQKDGCSVAAFGYTGGRSAVTPTAAASLDAAQASLASASVPFGSDSTAEPLASGGGVDANLYVQATDPRNSKPRALMIFRPSSGASSSALEGMWLDVVVRATGASACTGNMWLYWDVAAVHDFMKGFTVESVADGGGFTGYSLQNGDDHYTTTIPATANNVIAVGSYMPPRPAGAATSTWTADDGSTYNQSTPGNPSATGTVTNGLSLFSSLGPTADGRTKPDIVTPGEPIVSTKARNPGSGYGSNVTLQTSWVKMEGTSMASPHATGIVALMLQKNHVLTVAEARAALRTGTSTAGMTALTANSENSYGAGKVDAVAAMGSIAENVSSYAGTGDLSRGSNGGGGSGTSCAFVEGGRTRVAMAGASFILGIALIALARLHRRRKGAI